MTTGETKWCLACQRETSFHRVTLSHQRVGLKRNNGFPLKPIIRLENDLVTFCTDTNHPSRVSRISGNHTTLEERPLNTTKERRFCPGCQRTTVHHLIDIGPKDPEIDLAESTAVFICGRTRHPDRVSRVTLGSKNHKEKTITEII